MQYDIPPGIDGYYYAIQVHSLLESGRFYYPSHTPLVLYLMSLAARTSGNIVTGIKVTSILLHTILSMSLFALGTFITKSVWKGLLASTVTVISVTHLIWMGEFLNQLGGLAFFFLGAACLARNPKSNFWRLTALVCFVIAAFSHKSIVFLIALLLLISLLFRLLINFRNSKLSYAKILIVIVSCICLPSLASRQFVPLPQQVLETVLSIPQAPIKLTALEEKLSLLVLAPLALGLCLKMAPAKSSGWPHYAIGVTALFSILFTLNPFLSHGEELTTISQRLDLLSYLQISILLPGVVWLLNSRTTGLMISLSTLALLLLGNNPLPIGLQQGFVARRKALLNDFSGVRSKIPQNSIIIAPHGYEFLATYATGVRSQNSEPTNNDHDKNVLWLLFGTPCREGENITLLSKDIACTVLVSQKHPLLVTEAEKSAIIALNPHLKSASREGVEKVLSVSN